jgi:pyruvate/2-oxoglutarate dehydrogenase complex dihydrolipoamide acyltransferase (E2) component
MEIPILMPQLGESIAEATIVRLNVGVGDVVAADQEVIEVETNKATMGVTTLCAGTVSRITVEEGVTYPVGATLGILEVTVEEATRAGMLAPGEGEGAASGPEAAPGDGPGHQPHEKTPDLPPPPAHAPVEPSIRGLPVPAGMKGAHYISPRMRARMDELGLRASDISAVSGSGAGGRVTVEDLEEFLEYISEWPSSKASHMRMSVADAMRRSWTRPLASVSLPVCIDSLLVFRSRQDPKPPLTLYLLRAFAKCLSERPACAGYFIGENLVYPRSFDLGVAVQVEDGVMVPVLRHVDQRPAVELLDDYLELVNKARERRLPEAALGGGIATVTNFGTFGLVRGTPIPLPSETLILGIGAGVKHPVWDEESQSFQPRTQVELVLTFDHRVVDGGDAGYLLNHLNDYLQQPEVL